MHQILTELANFFLSLGGFGLVLLGTLDSSFLFTPLGNDLLVVLMTTQHPQRMPYYAAMAALGSTLGTWITESLSRKGGEAGLEGRVSKRRLEYVQRQVSKRAGLVLFVVCLMPPPFPFTVFIIVAAALQYPRWKLLTIVGAGRLSRFVIEGLLAVHYGNRILSIAKTPALQAVIFGLVIISIGGSAWSIYSWVKRSRGKRV